MEIQGKATRITLLDFTSPPMRAFHMAWIAFSLCFFAWFGIAPLMAVVRDELKLTKEQVGWLFFALATEGILLACFSRASLLVAAVPLLLAFGLFVKMSNGATYAVVPFVNRKALGAVSGIVGAGGNAGAVAAGFLFKGALDWSTGLLILGIAVTVSSVLALTVKLVPETQSVPQPAPVPELAGAAE